MTPTIEFPPLSAATSEGLIGVGGELSVANLHLAYSKGIFPWPAEDMPLLWFCPPRRGILFFADLKIPKSLQKSLKKRQWKLTSDRAFAAVIEACQTRFRPGQSGTWINDEMKTAYIDFHQAGYAHSFECWEGERLIGGLYGVYVKGVFAGESMFYLEPDASKFCLLGAIEFLRSAGVHWMDTQMVTPVLETFGAKEISRTKFLSLLGGAQKNHPETLDFKSVSQIMSWR